MIQRYAFEDDFPGTHDAKFNVKIVTRNDDGRGYWRGAGYFCGDGEVKEKNDGDGTGDGNLVMKSPKGAGRVLYGAKARE